MYITVTYDKALFKVCYPVNTEIESNKLSSLIKQMDTSNILDIVVVNGLNKNQDLLGTKHKKPYIYTDKKEFLDRIAIMCNCGNKIYCDYIKQNASAEQCINKKSFENTFDEVKYILKEACDLTKEELNSIHKDTSLEDDLGIDLGFGECRQTL